MWRVELCEEIVRWYEGLDTRDRAFADRALDRLRMLDPHLGMPRSQTFGGGLRDLRFTCEGGARRITYYLDVERTVITLTTFRMQRNNERRELDRAWLNMASIWIGSAADSWSEGH